MNSTTPLPLSGRGAGSAARAVLLFAASLAGRAQTPPPAESADQTWARVGLVRQAAVDAKVAAPRGLVAADRAAADRLRAERDTRARRFREAAQAARAFHLAHPADPRAAEARRLEVLAGLEAITPADRAHEQAALAAAAAFRADRSHPAADRLEVAHAMEGREIARRTLGRPWFAHPVLAEAMLDRLHAEFGDGPEVWARDLAFALNADCDAGREAAHRIVQSLTAPEPTQAAARRLLARYALVRQPLDFPLQPLRGRPTSLAQLAGRKTLVCLWDGARQPGGPPGLDAYRRNPPPNTSWVFISLGELGATGPDTRARSLPPGPVCVEPLGWRSPLAAKLQLSQLPFVLVLDAQKRLSGYGRIDEIPALLAGIGRPALP